MQHIWLHWPRLWFRQSLYHAASPGRKDQDAFSFLKPVRDGGRCYLLPSPWMESWRSSSLHPAERMGISRPRGVPFCKPERGQRARQHLLQERAWLPVLLWPWPLHRRLQSLRIPHISPFPFRHRKDEVKRKENRSRQSSGSGWQGSAQCDPTNTPPLLNGTNSHRRRQPLPTGGWHSRTAYALPWPPAAGQVPPPPQAPAGAQAAPPPAAAPRGSPPLPRGAARAGTQLSAASCLASPFPRAGTHPRPPRPPSHPKAPAPGLSVPDAGPRRLLRTQGSSGGGGSAARGGKPSSQTLPSLPPSSSCRRQRRPARPLSPRSTALPASRRRPLCAPAPQPARGTQWGPAGTGVLGSQPRRDRESLSCPDRLWGGIRGRQSSAAMESRGGPAPRATALQAVQEWSPIKRPMLSGTSALEWVVQSKRGPARHEPLPLACLSRPRLSRGERSRLPECSCKAKGMHPGNALASPP